jgi:hypothetical protein
MDVFIFTLGLTEAWVDKRTNRVFPTAPGTIAGDFDPSIYEFKNFTYDEIHADFVEFLDLIRARNPDVRVILTVSPVPLTATATDNHVLVATTYSKSVLRAVAGSIAQSYPDVDYFPSYEMIASPWSKGFFYEGNMRAVNAGGVAAVMRVFFKQHGTVETQAADEQPRQQPEERVPGAGRQRRRRLLRAGATAERTGQNAEEMANENVLPEVPGKQHRRQAKERAPGAKRQKRERPSRERPSRAEARAARAKGKTEPTGAMADEVVCEEILLEAFNR